MLMRQIYYGWIMVGVSLACFTLMWSLRATFGLFYTVLLEEFSWSRASGTLGYAMSWALLALFSPIAGYLIDRVGVRHILMLGMFCLTLLLGLGSQIHRLWHYVLSFGILLALSHACVHLSTATLLARWFFRQRGTVMGVMALGYSLGPLLFFPLLQWAILEFGWRSTMALGAVIPLVLTPIIWILVQDRPEDEPGELNSAADHSPKGKRSYNARSETWTLSKALRSGRYWALWWLYVLGVMAYQILLCIKLLMPMLSVTQQQQAPLCLAFLLWLP